jgi:signal transduction histidine kinase
MKFTIAFTLLFCYVIAAILFWGYSLNKQSKLMYNLEREKIEHARTIHNDHSFNIELEKIEDKKTRRTKQYLGEGGTFILITILSAILVYLAYYKQIRLSKLQKNFMLSITHELKTPIASIKLNMQTLEKRKLEESIQEKLIKSSVIETNRLDDLCNNILAATQLENTKEAIYHDEVNLHDLTQEVIKEINSRHKNIQFRSTFYDIEFAIKGDKSLWKLIVSNLLGNAVKYSKTDSSIEIVLEEKDKNIIYAVKDEGIGIEEQERKKIFEKFYRVGNENTRSSKGTGLGLYIVKKIVQLYKYDISVKNNIPNGSIFEIRIKT